MSRIIEITQITQKIDDTAPFGGRGHDVGSKTCVKTVRCQEYYLIP